MERPKERDTLLSTRQEQQTNSSHDEHVFSVVIDTWCTVLGFSREDIPLTEPVTRFADSLTIMQFTYLIEKSLSKRLTVAEIIENNTIESQVAFIQLRPTHVIDSATPCAEAFSPPGVDDVVFTDGDNEKFENLIRIASPALQALSLEWNQDVECVYEAADIQTIWRHSSRPESYNLRWVFNVTDASVGIGGLRAALEKTLSKHETFRSLLLQGTGNEDGNLVHVIIRPNARLFELCIRSDVVVDTATDLTKLLGDMSLNMGGPPLPLLQAEIVQITQSNTVGLLLSVHHGAFDAISMSVFLEDLRVALRNLNVPLPSRVPYKLFADTYYLHQQSASATCSVRYQVQKLHNVDNLESALWPKENGPYWLANKNDRMRDLRRSTSKEVSHQSQSPQHNDQDSGKLPEFRKESFPAFETLKSEHFIEAPTVVKAAVALFNCESTGQGVAVFSNPDAARHWPFMEGWIQERLPSASNIAGPTVGICINVIHFDPNETVLEMLLRLQKIQATDSKHAHAPWVRVAQELGERRHLLKDVGHRQFFNWDPSIRIRTTNTASSLNLIGLCGWMEYGFFWRFGLLDSTTLVGSVGFGVTTMTQHDASTALGRVWEMVQWLTNIENWSKTLKECPGPL